MRRQVSLMSAERWSLAACMVASVLLWLGPFLARNDLFSEDATQHVFWLYRYADPSLFPGDLSIEYFGAPSSAPWGYRTVYALVARWFDILSAAEWLAVLLLVWATVLAWRLGRTLSVEDPDTVGLLAAVCLLVLLPMTDILPPMALQRTVAMPLVLLCVWALVAKKYAWVGVSLIAAALFYPIVVPVLGLTSAGVFLCDLHRERRLPAHWMWNGILGAMTVAIVFLQSGTTEGIGPMVTFDQARTMPEFGSGGRQALFGTTLVDYWLRHHRTGLGVSPAMLMGLVLSLLAITASGRLRAIPRAVWMTAIAGIGLWLVARILLFHLYLPNRHSRWVLATFAIAICAMGTYAVLRLAHKRPLREGDALPRKISRGVAVAAPLVVVVALLPSASAAWKRPVDHDLERTYRYIASLPKDTLVAAHPDVADDVPLRTRRSVLASSEGSLSFMLGYYSRVKPRLEASLKAAYASSWAEVDRALQPYGVDVLLSRQVTVLDCRYYRPYDTLVHELCAKAIKRGFAVNSPPPGRILFQSGDWYVIRVPGPDATGG